FSPSSSAAQRVRWARAAFATSYPNVLYPARMPLMLDMLMKHPVRRATLDGEAYFIARKGARTCRARSRSILWIRIGDRSRRRRRTGVAHDAIHSAEALEGTVDERPDVPVAGDVRRDEHRAVSEQGGDGNHRRAPPTGDHHVCAFGGE